MWSLCSASNIVETKIETFERQKFVLLENIYAPSYERVKTFIELISMKS